MDGVSVHGPVMAQPLPGNHSQSKGEHSEIGVELDAHVCILWQLLLHN